MEVVRANNVLVQHDREVHQLQDVGILVTLESRDVTVRDQQETKMTKANHSMVCIEKDDSRPVTVGDSWVSTPAAY